MKNSEIQSFGLEELKSRLLSEQEALSKLKFAHALSSIENPMRIREGRKFIARLHTAIRLKELAK